MRAIPVELRIYQTAGGRHPFTDWLENLKDRIGAAAVMSRLNRLRAGNFGDAKALGNGVFELRVDFGPGYRVYFAKPGRAIVVLLCGGDKSTQSKDIHKAEGFQADYQRRSSDG